MSSFRVLELFCGIGGVAAALGAASRARIVGAVDVNTRALDVYRKNWFHPAAAREIAALTADELESYRADLWWLSPPCQPYTRRGARRDLDDPRSRSLVSVIDAAAVVRPRYLALENVVGFLGSRAHRLLVDKLSASGYREFRTFTLCPSELKVPNRRPRCYLVATTGELGDLTPPFCTEPRTLASYIEPAFDDAPDLRVDPSILGEYRDAVHIADREAPPTSPPGTTNCFTSAYGRSHVRSGSYLALPGSDEVRRFAPSEILRFLHFPESFELPSDLSTESGWRLVGNSLSILPVCTALSAIPELAWS